MSGSVVYDMLTLGIAAAVGALLGVWYDILKSIRLSFKLPFLAVFALDLLFFIVAAAVTFCLLLVRCRGYVRGFVIFGECVGFAVLRLTLSKPIVCALKFLLNIIKSTVVFIIDRIIKPARLCIFNISARILHAEMNIIVKSLLCVKKMLQRTVKLVYNYREEKYSTDLKGSDGHAGVTSPDNSQKPAAQKKRAARQKRQKKALKSRQI